MHGIPPPRSSLTFREALEGRAAQPTLAAILLELFVPPGMDVIIPLVTHGHIVEVGCASLSCDADGSTQGILTCTPASRSAGDVHVKCPPNFTALLLHFI